MLLAGPCVTATHPQPGARGDPPRGGAAAHGLRAAQSGRRRAHAAAGPRLRPPAPPRGGRMWRFNPASLPKRRVAGPRGAQELHPASCCRRLLMQARALTSAASGARRLSAFPRCPPASPLGQLWAAAGRGPARRCACRSKNRNCDARVARKRTTRDRGNGGRCGRGAQRGRHCARAPPPLPARRPDRAAPPSRRPLAGGALQAAAAPNSRPGVGAAGRRARAPGAAQ